MEKLLPQNIEAEAGVLGSIIIDPEAVVQVADFLRPEDFYRDAHRAIFQAVLELYAERGPADLITLLDELQRRGRLEEVGGAAYISSLVNRGADQRQRGILRAHRGARVDYAAADPRRRADGGAGL